MINAPARPSRQWLDLFLTGTLFGYVLMGRSFAHVGISPLYIGEMLMGSYLLARPLSTLGPVFAGLLRPTRYSFVVWTMALSFLYGLLQTVRGLAYGHSPSITIQNLVFHVYPIFLFVGLEIGRRVPNFLERIAAPLAWANGIYGLLYIFVFNGMGLTNTTDMYHLAIFGQPNWTALTMLLLLAFGGTRRSNWAALLINAFLLITIQSRAEWFSFAVCLMLWAVLSGRLFRMLQPALVLTMLLTIAWIADVKVPSPESRGGGEVSVRTLVGQVAAVFDHSQSHRADDSTRAGTITWRLGWWKEIWRMVHSTPQRTFFGPAYGYPIWELHPEGTDDFPLRTPHNVMMYTLGYTGWIGFLLFLVCQLTLGLLCWQSYRESGQALCFCVWVMGVIRAVFDNYFETPHLAIVFFLTCGLLLAHEEGCRAQRNSLLPDAAP